VFLIDYHRPINHKNIFSSKQIRFVDDGFNNMSDDLT
jgi:hypothetical protein